MPLNLTHAKINKMKKPELQQNLTELGLSTDGLKPALKLRLTSYLDEEQAKNIYNTDISKVVKDVVGKELDKFKKGIIASITNDLVKVIQKEHPDPAQMTSAMAAVVSQKLQTISTTDASDSKSIVPVKSHTPVGSVAAIQTCDAGIQTDKNDNGNGAKGIDVTSETKAPSNQYSEFVFNDNVLNDARVYIHRNHLHSENNKGKNMGYCLMSARTAYGEPVFVAHLEKSSTCTGYLVPPKAPDGMKRPSPVTTEYKRLTHYRVNAVFLDGSKAVNLQNEGDFNIRGEVRVFILLFQDLDDANTFCDMYHHMSFAPDEDEDNANIVSGDDIWGDSQNIMEETVTRHFD